MIDYIRNTQPVYIASGQTHSVYRVGHFACKIAKHSSSPDDKNEYDREIYCLQLLAENLFPCVNVIAVFDGNDLVHSIFKNKVILVEEFINGESLYDNHIQKKSDYPILYDLIEKINSYTHEHFGYILEHGFSSWNRFLDAIKERICDFLKRSGNFELYNKMVKLDLSSTYNGSPHILLMEFNPHNFIFDGMQYRAIDVNSLLCGDVIYQWVRLKTHLELRRHNHYCDRYLQDTDEELIKKYVILSCGNDILTRSKLGLNYQKEWDFFTSKVMSYGERL